METPLTYLQDNIIIVLKKETGNAKGIIALDLELCREYPELAEQGH